MALPQDWESVTKVDVHMHIRAPTIPWIRREDDVISAARALGIDEMWCSVPITGGRIAQRGEVRACNDLVLAAMHDHPDLIRGYCYVDPSDTAEALSEMERCRNAGMIGVKLYNQFKIDHPLVEPIAQLAIKLDMLLLTHAAHLNDERSREAQPNTSDAADICALAARFPRLRIIEGHIGGGGDWEWTLRRLRDCRNVYLDTSGSGIDAGMVDRCVAELGVERVLFATDTWMEEGVGKVLAADLTPTQRDSIFSGNARRLLSEIGR